MDSTDSTIAVGDALQQIMLQNLASHERDEREAARRAAERLALRAQQEQERAEWIAAHGSARLRRLLAEGIEHQAVYRDERLALERPGWRYEQQVRGRAAEPRNVPEEAFDLLDEARKLEPAARLVYWQVEHECDAEACAHDCPGYDYRGYVALAEFLGREIILGGPTA